MHIALLGPLDIRHGGHDIRISSHHQRALVAALASEAGKVISAETLIDTVWADRPPATARTKLQGYISATRRMLGCAEPGGFGWPILTRDPGYLFSVDGVTIDLFEYRRLLRLASCELDIGHVSVASHHLDQALGLWRGSAFADASTPTLARMAGALERGRLLAVERKAECDLRLGHYDAVAEELTLFVAANPLREGMRAALMLALYWRGCRAEALESYRAGRRILRDELGIEPGSQLRRLHELMLSDDPELSTQAALGRVLQAVPSDGSSTG
jgi:DNA-binding SARP family transcriptional activator